MKTNPTPACGRLLISLALAGFAVTAFAQNPAPNSRDVGSATANLKRADRSFVEDAAKAGDEEVAISRVAVDRATNPQVKEFAQMMVDDHTNAGSNLSSLATQKGIQLPTKTVDVEKWTKKNAKSFDKDYMDKMVSDHKDAVELFEKETKRGGDADLAAFASKTLPTLQTHLAKAQEIKNLVK